MRYTGAAPQRIIDLLTPAVPQLASAQRAQAYAVLVEQYLQQTPPDRLAAAQTLQRWLMLHQVADPNGLRLLLAEQMLALDRFAEAKQVLARVSSSDPRARQAWDLLVRCHLALGEQRLAADLLRRLLAASPPPELPRLRYLLGSCLADLGEDEAAKTTWQQAASGTGPAAIAAHLKLGVALAERDPATALKHWKQVLSTAPPLIWDQPYFNLATLRRDWEKTWQAWLASGQFALAARLAQASRAWLPPGVALERQGQAEQLAGRAAQRRAEDGQADHWPTARAHFRAAAAAFEEAALLPAASPEQRLEWQWLAAENLLRAQNYPRAAVLLELCLASKLPPRRRAEAQIGLAEALHALGARDQALRLLTEALPHAGPLALRARYLQAMIYIDLKDYVRAEAALAAITTSGPSFPEPSEVRQARFALGYVLHWQQRFPEAAAALESAVRWHPDSPEAVEAEYWWADALLQAAVRLERTASRDARSESTREYLDQRRRQWLLSALEHFQRFLARSSDLSSTPERDRLLSAARFGLGDTLLALERYDEAAQVFETLALAHDYELDGAKALRQLAVCLLGQGKKAEVQTVLSRLRERLAALPDNAFAPPRWPRSEWERWLRDTRTVVEGSAP
jgi:tetratricopeptide (TPR) repeat protein